MRSLATGRFQPHNSAANKRIQRPTRLAAFAMPGAVSSTRAIWRKVPLLVLGLVVALSLLWMPVGAAHGTGTTKTHHTSTHVHSLDVKSIIQTVLNNLAVNGYDPLASGLWVNWSTGNSLLATDFVAGTPTCLVQDIDVTCTAAPGHDPLTDLRYLRNLWTYKANNPGDNTYDAQIALYSPIVQREFTPFAKLSMTGWLFDEWVSLAQLSGDNTYVQIAQSDVNFWYTHYYHPALGALYFINQETTGTYRVDYTIEMALALVEAGALFQQPS